MTISTPPRDTSDDTAEPIAWAVYGGRTGVLRYVLQDEERVFELVESGYVARPLFEHPAPTPPAENVRDALIALLRDEDDTIHTEADMADALMAALVIRMPAKTVELAWPLPASHQEPAAARIARSLGLDPHETVADSLNISPIGEGFSVKWQGVKFLSRAEVLDAIHPDREQNS